MMSPVPATTGQLRTRVQDMEIGDYIKAVVYNDTSSADVVYIYPTNGMNYSELPLTGATSGFGYGYLVKVAGGLCVFDRVVRHTVSWDQLNTWKLIQGKPWSGENIIPTMTSNTAPSGVASASSEDTNGGALAWKAFNGTTVDGNDMWSTQTGITSAWLKYDFGLGNEKKIRRYSVTSQKSTNSQTLTPKNWTFEGSNDNTNWTILDTQNNQSAWSSSGGETRSFMLSSIANYRYYRINISANNGGSLIAIGEMRMIETVGIIRSLTGGVAYADANGNKSTTDPSSNLGGTYGGWPINNEWDALICSFSADKIQTGKTLDDIFHWSNCQTWTQDTPWNASTNRITRGANALRTFHIGYASNNVSSSRGFRPVFEYRE